MIKIEHQDMLNRRFENKDSANAFFFSQNMPTGITNIDTQLGGLPQGAATLLLSEDDEQRFEFLVTTTVENLRQGYQVILFDYNQDLAQLFWWSVIAQCIQLPVSHIMYGLLSHSDIKAINNLVNSLMFNSLTIYVSSAYYQPTTPINPQSMLYSEDTIDNTNAVTFGNLDLGSLDSLLDIDGAYEVTTQEVITILNDLCKNKLYKNTLVLFRMYAINDAIQIQSYREIVTAFPNSHITNQLTFIIDANSARLSRQFGIKEIWQSGHQWSFLHTLLQLSKKSVGFGDELHLLTASKTLASSTIEIKFLMP